MHAGTNLAIMGQGACFVLPVLVVVWYKIRKEINEIAIKKVTMASLLTPFYFNATKRTRKPARESSEPRCCFVVAPLFALVFSFLALRDAIAQGPRAK